MKKLVFIVFAVILGVTVANAQNTQRQGQRQGQGQGQGQGQRTRMSPEDMVKRQVEFVKQTLNLEEGEQLEKVKKVYETQAKKINELREGDTPREQMREKFTALREETDKELAKILTKEQIAKLKEAQEKMRVKRSERQPRGEGRGQGRGQQR